eukprot:CAMPEP_0167739960 /NCGR_PEP_ID=MMETSP0110_2-20121227/12_1 /TAXON_ID=629695 /ORGANISM="Gymnochlora sp., Strain CCMP2014" /LENGTH=330 /DNA_ID=CAMNT_0007623801 /DNA_START=237 /DNA_END=1226 /DNA_ORIENTATION=-
MEGVAAKEQKPCVEKKYKPKPIVCYYSDPELNRIKDSTEFILEKVDKNTMFLPCNGNGTCAVREKDDRYHPVYVDGETAKPLLSREWKKANLIYLGKARGKTYIGVDITLVDDIKISGDMLRPKFLRTDIISRLDAAIMTTAVGKATFHKNSRFCGRCGSKTESKGFGTKRVCTNCGYEVFPRQDPAMIVLVSHGEYCLLGRQARWPKGWYSCLAGFVEVGESLEDAVVREVLEESSIHVERDSVRYIASQPWPFPQSYMIGFHAEAKKTEDGSLPKIDCSDDELETARWISRKEMKAKLEWKEKGEDLKRGDFGFPGPHALAHQLIKAW